MKKRIISICLIFSLLCLVIPKPKAKAAGAEIALAAASAYAVANASGLLWAFQGPAGTAQDFMEEQINLWLDGQRIEDVFGQSIAKKVATKLVIGQQAYNAIKTFLNEFISDKGITGNDKVIGGGVGDLEADQYYDSEEFTIGNFQALEAGTITTETSHQNFWKFRINGVERTETGGTFLKQFILENLGYSFKMQNKTTAQVYGVEKNRDGLRLKWLCDLTGLDGFEIGARTDSWSPPNVDVGYQWEGELDGTLPGTNLAQLIRDIFSGVDNNDINVEAEVTEADPEPTPAPTTPPAEDILEGINDIIGQLDNIKEGVGEVTGSLTETIEGTAEAVESIEGTLSDALAMPDSEELPDFKFDLRELFPFCIPFDIYNLLSRFDASPTAPHVQIPFTIASIGFEYNIDLDFSAFDSVAAVLRTVEFIVYAIGLALVTGKVIKW